MFYPVWNLSQPPVSQRRLDRLTSQLDTNAVQHLLGTPQNIEKFTDAHGSECFEWTYYRPNGWRFVTLTFSPDGHFDRYITD